MCAASTVSPDSRTRLLDLLERAGNRLPHPVTLFILFAALVPLLSAIAAGLGISVLHPRTGEPVVAVNLLTRSWIQRGFTECVANFVAFAPLGTVLAAMIGVGIAERSGLLAAALRGLVQVMPRRFITATILLAGMLSHTAGDAGNLVLPPLAAALFAALGRPPLAGIAVAFAGIACGFSANMLPSTIDVLLAGLTQEAARLWDPAYVVQVVCNYYFLTASVPLLILVGVFINARFVEPRLTTEFRESIPAPGDESAESAESDALDRRGLRAAGWALLATAIGFGLLAGFEWSPLRSSGETALERLQPFLRSIVALVVIAFAVPGIAFGIATGRIRSDHDAARMAGEAVGTMGLYIVLSFAAAQFVKYFEWSNLGAILAILGAQTLRALHINGTPLYLGLLLITTTINLLIASASAKWTVLAPIFVPMFMLLGHSPESTQVIFRVGDSVTNGITPLNPYFPIMLAFAHRYDPRFGIGSLVAVMLPYAVGFALVWTAMLIGWIALGWPVGPGSGLSYPAG